MRTFTLNQASAWLYRLTEDFAAINNCEPIYSLSAVKSKIESIENQKIFYIYEGHLFEFKPILECKYVELKITRIEFDKYTIELI